MTAAAQLDIFSVPLHRGGKDEDRFWSWLEKNGPIYERILFWARAAKKSGSRVGMRLLVERARWEHFVELRKTDADFSLNDHVAPYLARLIERDVPDLKGFFELRERAS